jgi:hypothetical protein
MIRTLIAINETRDSHQLLTQKTRDKGQPPGQGTATNY